MVELLWLVACGRDAPGFDVSFGTGVDDGTDPVYLPTTPAEVDPIPVVPAGALRARWSAPTRIALDPTDGTLRVTDPRRGRVYVLDADGTARHAEKVGGEPLAVGVDPEGRTWVGDGATGEVRCYDRDWDVVARASDAERPSDLAIDSATGWVYVTDPPADLVRVYNADGEPIGTFDGGTEDTALLYPTGIAVGAGEVWVVSQLPKRIVKLDSLGRPVAWFGDNGEYPGEIYMPQGLALDGHGRLWVADARLGRVTAFDRAGRYLGFGGTVGPAPGQMDLPMDVVVTADDRVLVTSTNNARVEVFDAPWSAR